MRAGRLRKSVAIQEESAAADSQGGYVNTWTPISGSPVYGEVLDLSARERVAAQQLESEIAVAISIRHRTGITAGMRAVVDGLAYNIRGVRDPDGRKRMLALDCERGVAL